LAVLSVEQDTQNVAAVSGIRAGNRPGGNAGPGRVHVALAVPVGSRRARSQQEWLACALTAIVGAGWRCDRAANFAAVCRVLAVHMDWSARTARPTWQILGELAARSPGRPLSRATVARCLAWLCAVGLLGVVEHGSTASFRPRKARHHTTSPRHAAVRGAPYAFTGDGNRAALYVLCVRKRPSQGRAEDVARTETPSWSCKGPCKGPRTREARHGGHTTATAPPGTMLAVCQALTRHSRLSPLARLSARHLRYLIRDFITAGWTGRDILHAIDYQPNGAAWSYTSPVRHPAGWVPTRLDAWRTSDGRPLPSPSQRSRQERQRLRDDQAQARRNAATVAAKWVDPRTSPARAAARRIAQEGWTNREQRASTTAADRAASNPAPQATPSPQRAKSGRAAHRHLRPVPSMPPDPQQLTVSGLARILLVVRDPAARTQVTQAYFRARPAARPSVSTFATSGRTHR
jgi:hypothetical protein